MSLVTALVLVHLTAAAQQPQEVHPVLAFPEPGLDDPAAYRGYRTRFYRDAAGNAVQVFIDSASARVVTLLANAANESVGFTLRDLRDRPLAPVWGGEVLRTWTSGEARVVQYDLAAHAGAVGVGHFVLGSMRVERDFRYQRRHLAPLSAPPYRLPELDTLVARLGRLAEPERRRHLRVLGVQRLDELERRVEPVTACSPPTADRWECTVEHTSFDGRQRLTLAIGGDARRLTAAVEGGALVIHSRAGAPIHLTVTIRTTARPLTPLTREQIFNDAFRAFYAAVRADSARNPQRFRRVERQVRGTELLSYREKLMAGLPNFATYFGRDMMMAALMMEPIWTAAMQEHVIAAVLAKLAPNGEVSHEEALGGQAIRENAARYNELLHAFERTPADSLLEQARRVLAELRAVRENYHMVDDDYQLPVLVARYLARADVEAERKREFLSRRLGAVDGARYVELVVRNLAYVAERAAPYAAQPAAANLVAFPRFPDGSGWFPGSWRDSRAGYGGGRFALDVNAAWVPAAIRATETILAELRRLGWTDTALMALVPEAGADDLRRYIRAPDALNAARRAWSGARRHFTVEISAGDVRARLARWLDGLPEAERRYWQVVADSVGPPREALQVLALSLDSAGNPIAVMNTDVATLWFLEDVTDGVLRGARPGAAALDELVPVVRPYPWGLFVPGLGPLVANDVFAPAHVQRAFRADQYHSPRVVWGREVNLILLALAREIEASYDAAGKLRSEDLADYTSWLRDALDRTVSAVEASGLKDSELWSYRILGTRLEPERYGTSSDVQLWNMTDLAVQFALARLPFRGGDRLAPDTLYDPARDLGPLFEAVQLSGLFEDSKTFVDARPRVPPAVITARYEAERGSPGFRLASFVERHFELPRPVGEGFRADTTRPMEEHIRALWPVLTRPPDSVGIRSSLIPLPHAYLVPGGRFREVYYWDSYFTMLGLVESGETDLVRSMLDNFAHLVRAVGHIPNGNRTYYVSRSQPPFFAAMVGLYATATDTTEALRYLDALEAEHAFWMDGAEGLAPGEAYRRVVRLPSGAVLNRYWDDRPAPRPESFREDYRLGQTLPEETRVTFYRNVRAAAESGWDFSSRWMRDPSDLRTLETTALAPVDLNSLLYHLERTIAAFRARRGRPGDGDVAERFALAAEQRRRALLAVAFDPDSGFFYDVRWRTGQRVTDRPTMAAAAVLYFGLATPEQGRAVAARLERDFLKPGGFVTTGIVSGQQWDAPNGWPPLQWMAIQGVRRYGHEELANRARERWLTLNRRTYVTSGRMMEKYDVVDLDRRAGGGEYPTQDGFGWTNGVALALIAQVAAGVGAGPR